MTMHWEWLLPGYLAIVLHEVAHAYMAFISGDWTAKMLGRVSLNPLRHTEWMGTVAVPLATLPLIGLPLGWARPVPVNFLVLTGMQRIRVALAGPLCNVAQAGAWVLVPLVASVFDFDEPAWLRSMWAGGVTINGVLALVNLLPFLPLDGGRVVHLLLPPQWGARMVRYEWAQMVALGVLAGVAAYWWRH